MDDYRDLLDLPHHVSETRLPMPVRDRAAQFASFAALKGYEAAIGEAGRVTESRIEPDENELEELNRRLQRLARRQDERPEVTVTWFVPDLRKDGGAYLTETVRVRKVDANLCLLRLADGRSLPFSDISALTGEAAERDEAPADKE